jgi:hypothetical protein
MPVSLYPDNWNAAVFCAAAGCNHLDCHGNRFTVVFVAIKEMKVFDYVLSTEDVLWSLPPYPGAQQHDGHLHLEPSALVGNALYFVLQPDNKILEYNVGTREMAVIRLPKWLLLGAAHCAHDRGGWWAGSRHCAPVKTLPVVQV